CQRADWEGLHHAECAHAAVEYQNSKAKGSHISYETRLHHRSLLEDLATRHHPSYPRPYGTHDAIPLLKLDSLHRGGHFEEFDQAKKFPTIPDYLKGRLDSYLALFERDRQGSLVTTEFHLGLERIEVVGYLEYVEESQTVILLDSFHYCVSRVEGEEPEFGIRKWGPHLRELAFRMSGSSLPGGEAPRRWKGLRGLDDLASDKLDRLDGIWTNQTGSSASIPLGSGRVLDLDKSDRLDSMGKKSFEISSGQITTLTPGAPMMLNRVVVPTTLREKSNPDTLGWKCRFLCWRSTSPASSVKESVSIATLLPGQDRLTSPFLVIHIADTTTQMDTYAVQLFFFPGECYAFEVLGGGSVVQDFTPLGILSRLPSKTRRATHGNGDEASSWKDRLQVLIEREEEEEGNMTQDQLQSLSDSTVTIIRYEDDIVDSKHKGVIPASSTAED
ncbi:hypothetical protein DFP72DRAFT_862778, partial [Ephemerocybe angulata]